MDPVTFEEERPDDYLLRVAASEPGRAYKRLALSALGICSGDAVADLGCGPAADLPSFAKAVGDSGRVIGVDHDPAALSEAVARTRHLPQVEVRHDDLCALGLPDACVDRVHADRVLQHVADPVRALSEARRIARGGGTAVFAEPDWDTLAIDYPDVCVARAFTRFVADRVVRNACIGRQLPRLAQRVGFAVESVLPVTTVFRDGHAADEILGLHRVTSRAVGAGYLTAEAAAAWLDHLAGQPFFASVTLFVVAVRATDTAL